MIECDPSNLIDALLFVEKATGRTCEESLERAAKHTVIGSGSYPGAMQLTPKATTAAIDAVPDKLIRGFVIKKLKQKGRWPMASPVIAQLIAKERARRRRSVGYAAYAGWNNAAIAFGGRGIKGITEDFPRSDASGGYGEVHKSAHETLAEMTNNAPAIERIGEQALQDALDNAAKDLVDYGERKLYGVMQKVNP